MGVTGKQVPRLTLGRLDDSGKEVLDEITSIGCEGRWVDESGLLVKDAEARVQVIEFRIVEPQRNDGRLHRPADQIINGQVCSEAVPAPEKAFAAVPNGIAHPLEVNVSVKDIIHDIPSFVREPCLEVPDFAGALRSVHLAEHHAARTFFAEER